MGILALEDKQRGVINVRRVWRVDGRRWLAAGLVLNIVYSGVIGLIMMAGTDWMNAQNTLWTMRSEVIIIMTYVTAAIITQRLRSIGTIILAAIGLLFFTLAYSGSLLWNALPAASLAVTAGIISGAAIWRLVEYYDMLHNSGLEQPPRLTFGAWLWYLGFAIIPFLLVYI